ncbi:hypothetical protein [Dactylosporangium sp. CA-139066]|uniref:hypothetical protein n=1 Tax=Dactylosporangium sp. CA-139066 TaxID=3239930 RepID=UPI003D8EF955
MRASVRDALSIVVGLVGLAALGIGLNQMLNTGSCVSGGPYVSARQCPSDEIYWTLLLIFGLLVWLAGIFLSRQGLVRPGTGQLLWTLGFAGLGTAVLIKALVQDDVPADARLGAYIIAGVFIPMGLAAGVAGLLQLRGERRAGVRPVRRAASDETWERLQRLRSAGTLTRDEFDRLREAIDEAATAERLDALQRLANDRAEGRLDEREFADRKRAALAQ